MLNELWGITWGKGRQHVLAGLHRSGAERTVEKIIAEDPQGLGKDFARILGATFNLNLMPQILAPLYEQAANRNSFTKAPIETPGMENVQPFLRSKPGTSETMKAAGMATRDLPESLQVNPARAEALLRGYFNTCALYGLMLTDQALFRDKLPEKRADEMPVVRRFYSQEPARHTKYETEFYDLLTEAKRLRGTMRELDQMGYRTYADDKEHLPLAGEAKSLERAQKSLAGINNDMEQVRRDASLTPAEKRQKLDALTVERNALFKGAVTDSKAAQKERAP
ncbi:MAG: LPD38 domain-containing protein [Sulfuritalea sp.]|nr:LPD38 domain-containing protein [Sulfuritalea sp.]